MQGLSKEAFMHVNKALAILALVLFDFPSAIAQTAQAHRRAVLKLRSQRLQRNGAASVNRPGAIWRLCERIVQLRIAAGGSLMSRRN